VRAKAPLIPAPEIVGEPDCRHGRYGRIAPQSDEPTQERQPQAAVIDRRRAAGEQRVQQLPAAVCEAGGVATRGAVPDRQLQLGDPQARTNRVDGHPHLAAEAGGEREAGLPRRLRERSLAGKRLAR
jgi:hypothetical protein